MVSHLIFNLKRFETVIISVKNVWVEIINFEKKIVELMKKISNKFKNKLSLIKIEMNKRVLL